MEVERTKLLEVLNGIRPAIAKRGGEEDMRNKIVFTGADAVAYSESMCIIRPFETDFRTVAPSEEIIQVLDSMSANVVELIYSKGALNIKTGHGQTTVRIKTNPESRVLNDVDALLALTDTEWWMLPGEMTEENEYKNEFVRAVELCMYSTSKDNTQRALMCVCVNGDKIMSSDDFRISHYQLTEGTLGHTMLIPQPACVELVKNKVEKYAVSDTWLFFNTDTTRNIMVASRVIPEIYDDVEPFFEFEGEPYLLPEGIVDNIDTVSVLAPGEQAIEKEITVEMEPNKITLIGEKDVGFARALIEANGFNVAYPASFGINPEFFKHILKKTRDVKLGREKGLFAKDTFRHLIGLTPK